MDYVTFDPATGTLTGSYTCQDPAEGESYIEVTPEQQARWTLYRMNAALDGLEVMPAPAPTDPPVVHLEVLKKGLVMSVDDYIAAILQKWLRFQAGYEKREAVARAYVAAGCDGDPGVWITAFAEPAGLSNADAAALIVMQADALQTALEKLEAARMGKYRIHAASTPEAARAEYQSIIATADAIAKELK